MLTNCSQTFLRVITQKATRSQELPSCLNTSVFSVFTHLGTNPETTTEALRRTTYSRGSNLPKKKGIVGDKMKRISVVFAKHIKPHTRAPNLGIVFDLRNNGREMRRGDVVHEIEPALCRNTLVTGTRVTSKKKVTLGLDRQLACATREPDRTHNVGNLFVHLWDATPMQDLITFKDVASNGCDSSDAPSFSFFCGSAQCQEVESHPINQEDDIGDARKWIVTQIATYKAFHTW